MVSRELCTITAYLVISSFSIAAASASTATLTIQGAMMAPAVNVSSVQSLVPVKTSSVVTSSNVPSTPKPTTETTVSTKPAKGTPAPSGRKFDAASFFGGIILGIVVAVVLIFGYKWYQNRKKSYHSL